MKDTIQQLKDTKIAAKTLLSLSDDQIDKVLCDTADAIVENSQRILEANAKDLELMDANDPKYDRLRLTTARIESIAADMRNVSHLPSPKRVIERRVLPNGLQLEKVAVPFGVIGVIYEARPNVTPDVFSLCFKSGNACVLKGGHDAAHSNAAIVEVIHDVLRKHDINVDIVALLSPTRKATDCLLAARGVVDLIIPRGSASLIESVRTKAKVPVIETGAGVCHCYVDKSADIFMAAEIVNNAKTRRVSVCNALDCMICHRDVLSELHVICAPLAQSSVTIHADERAYEALKDYYPEGLLVHATESDYGTEYLSYNMAVKTVDNLDEALEHIEHYGSGHSEAAVTDDRQVAQRFYKEVDAACVYVNAPTSFTDGAQFGLGAEIGISTQKLHARGPMALSELMTYKWLVLGDGQTRP